MPDNERLTINIPQFCELTGISKNLGYALARQDKLGVPVIHLGKRLVLSRKAVIAWLEGDSNKTGGIPS